MRLKKYALALVTAAALAGGGIAAPAADAQSVAQATPQPVEGLTWKDADVVAGGSVSLKPEGTASSPLRFVGPGDAVGFTFKTNDQTGEVTVTAPVNGRAGDGVRFAVDVYKPSDDRSTWVKAGSYPVTVMIKADGTDQAHSFEPTYKPLVVAERQSATAARQGAVPAGTTYEIVHAPESYTVTVDAQGTVTVKPDEKVGAGSTNSARVKITYPDKSYEFTDLSITVSDANGNTTPYGERDAAKYEPRWADKAMTGDQKPATSPQLARLPAGTTFKLREDLLGNLSGYFEVGVDKHGAITVTPKAPLKDGVSFQIAVQVTYPDMSSETRLADFRITEAGVWQRETSHVRYDEINSPSNQTATAKLAEGVSYPKGTVFSLASIMPDGWSAAVDKTTGTLTVTPEKYFPGGTTTIFVRATFPDGSSESYPVPAHFTAPVNGLGVTTNVSYKPATVGRGTSTTVGPTVSPQLPAGTTFSGPNQDSNGVSLRIDASTGSITITVHKDASAGDQTLALPVTVSFPDGTQKKVEAKVSIGKPAAQPPRQTDATPDTPDGSSPAGIAGIIIGVLALLGGIGAAILAFMQNNGGVRL